MKLPKNLLQYIESEARKIDFGEITIKLNATTKSMDVVIQTRERFDKEPPIIREESEKFFKKG
jgi:hypothetical protein